MMRFLNISLLGMSLFATACTHTARESDECFNANECVDQVYIHQYGVRVRPDYWSERGKNGQIVSTLRDGVVVTQSYSGGELHGECSYTYPNTNKVCRSEVYENNVLQKETHYYRSGAPKQTSEWTSPNCKTISCWYECGAPRCVEKFEDGHLLMGEYFNKKGDRDSWVYNGNGERLSRDSNGYFLSHDEFHGGELCRRTYLYPTKGPREIVCLKDGIPHGERKTFYPDGSPCSIETWENGHQNGNTVIFQNGERYADIPYLDGKKNGIEKRYIDGAHLSQEITWFNDQMHGPTFTYVGESVQTDWFYKGKMTSRSNFESYYAPCQ